MKNTLNHNLVIIYIAVSLFAIFFLFYQVIQDDYNLSISKRLSTNKNFSLPSVVQEFNQKQYKVYVKDLPYKIDPEYKKSVDEAVSYWEQKENVDFVYTDEEENADLIIYWAKDFSVGHVGYAYENLIEIGLGDSYCYNDWRPYSYEYVTQNMKHEFGHFLGYEHSQDENDIMYFQSKQEYDYTLNESDVLPSGYYQYYGVCTLYENTKLSIIVSSDKNIDVLIVPSYEDYELMIDGKKYDSYEKCSSSDINNYSLICNVSDESGIVIINKSKDNVNFSIEVSEEY
ncbi:hypothetical protein COU57_05960 [Candidatus Pacearchaeota archaeon CG10_big_fil_rev_8_21_14_0_10_32_14]|nr:MAG: hypothetical protein COU57_05960 [Candidatus Pacearchaeota archaeon CG10_big_fil_rev_8_21_14_0_10_32_14]